MSYSRMSILLLSLSLMTGCLSPDSSTSAAPKFAAAPTGPALEEPLPEVTAPRLLTLADVEGVMLTRAGDTLQFHSGILTDSRCYGGFYVRTVTELNGVVTVTAERNEYPMYALTHDDCMITPSVPYIVVRSSGRCQHIMHNAVIFAKYITYTFTTNAQNEITVSRALSTLPFSRTCEIPASPGYEYGPERGVVTAEVYRD